MDAPFYLCFSHIIIGVFLVKKTHKMLRTLAFCTGFFLSKIDWSRRAFWRLFNLFLMYF